MQENKIGLHRVFIHGLERRQPPLANAEAGVAEFTEKPDHFIGVIVKGLRPLAQHLGENHRLVRGQGVSPALEYQEFRPFDIALDEVGGHLVILGPVVQLQGQAHHLLAVGGAGHVFERGIGGAGRVQVELGDTAGIRQPVVVEADRRTLPVAGDVAVQVIEIARHRLERMNMCSRLRGGKPQREPADVGTDIENLPAESPRVSRRPFCVSQARIACSFKLR